MKKSLVAGVVCLLFAGAASAIGVAVPGDSTGPGGALIGVPAQNYAYGSNVGASCTWQQFSIPSQRAQGWDLNGTIQSQPTYTNNTGHAIYVALAGDAPAASSSSALRSSSSLAAGWVAVYVNGAQAASYNGTGAWQVNLTVPDGQTYSVLGSQAWSRTTHSYAGHEGYSRTTGQQAGTVTSWQECR